MAGRPLTSGQVATPRPLSPGRRRAGRKYGGPRDSNPRLGLERASPRVVISPTSTPGATARCHSAGSSAAGPRASAVETIDQSQGRESTGFQSCPALPSARRDAASSANRIVTGFSRQPSTASRRMTTDDSVRVRSESRAAKAREEPNWGSPPKALLAFRVSRADTAALGTNVTAGPVEGIDGFAVPAVAPRLPRACPPRQSARRP